MRKISTREALIEALEYNLMNDDRVFLAGQDVSIVGGGMGQSKGLIEKFGPKRIIDTPISENAIVGLGIGAALTGLKPVVEIMYIDFVTCCADMILNQMAKIHYMFGGQVKIPMVLRTVSGTSGRNAAQHSNNFYAMFLNTPGLIVIAPSSPYDFKGLFNKSIIDDNPVIFIEHKRIYNIKGDVPDEYYTIPFGEADVKRKGSDLTIVATQALVHDALKVADYFEKEGIMIEVIDPRTLNPLDKKTIFKSVKKTGKIIVADEGCLTCGFSSEVSSLVAQEMFDYLDAPIIKIGSPDTPVPYSPKLEDEYIPGEKEIKEAINKIFK